jgi:hypothetical protein
MMTLPTYYQLEVLYISIMSIVVNFLDIDECSEGSHNCSKYAKCKNSHGGYSCECHTGYEGDGETCTRMLD